MPMRSRHEAPLRRLTPREVAEFARSFPLVEGFGEARPPSNPNHNGQPVPAEHEPPMSMAQLEAASRRVTNFIPPADRPALFGFPPRTLSF